MENMITTPQEGYMLGMARGSLFFSFWAANHGFQTSQVLLLKGLITFIFPLAQNIHPWDGITSFKWKSKKQALEGSHYLPKVVRWSMAEMGTIFDVSASCRSKGIYSFLHMSKRSLSEAP